MMIAAEVAAAVEMIDAGLAAGPAGQTVLAAAAARPERRVGSLAELQAALKTARTGDVIALAPGSYDVLSVERMNLPGVTVKGRGATVAGLRVVNGGGVAFDGFRVAFNGATNSEVLARNAKGVAFRNLVVSNKPGGYGAFIGGSSDVSVEGGDFSHVRMAIVVAKSDGVVVRGVKIHNVTADGVNVSATSNVRIEDNVFTDFQPAPGEHPDAIQFMTVGATASAENIAIRRNRILRGGGGAMQGIFITPQGGGQPYRNVTVEDNFVVGAMGNGIGLANVHGLTLTGNTVQPIDGQGSRIHLAGVQDARVADNHYAALSQGAGNSGLKILDKAKLRPISAKAAGKLQ